MNVERRKIEFLTEAASGFRGIRLIAFGLFFIGVTTLNYLAELASQKRNYISKDITYPVLFILLCVVAGIILNPKVRNYFGDKFGRTTAKPPTIEKRLQVWLCVIPIIFSFFIGSWMDVTYHFPFSVTVLMVAGAALIFWLENYQKISNITLYLTGIFFVSAFLPWETIFQKFSFLDNYSARITFYQSVSQMLLGISYVVMGLDDLRLLSSMIKPIQEGENYESF